MSTPRSTLRRWLVVIALMMVLLVGGAVLFLRVQFHGTALAGNIESMLNKKMSGRVHFRSIDWPTSSLTQVVTGGWVPFTVEGVDLWDAEGKQILHVDRITGELDIHALMFGNHDFVLRNVVLDTGWAVLEDIPDPNPLHAYDTTVISLFAAFYKKATPGFHWGATAESPPVFDIRDFELRNVDLTLRFGFVMDEQRQITGYDFEVVARGVDGEGFFYIDPSDPLVPKIYYSIPNGEAPITAESADITILDDYKVHLKQLEMTRLAQLPTEWPDDPVANDLEIKVTGITEQDAQLTVDGILDEYWDSPFGGNYAINAWIENGGQLAHDVIDNWMSGDRLAIHAEVTGPIVYPKVKATLTDLEYNVELRQKLDPLRLFLDKLVVDFDLATETGSLRDTQGRVEQPGTDGVVQLSAKFGISPYNADARLTIPRATPIELGWILPDELKAAFGTQIWGSLHAVGDSEITQEINELDMHLGTPGDPRSLHVQGGNIFAKNEFEVIELAGVGAHAGQTRTRIDGEFRPEPETFDLTIDVDSDDLDSWLRRFGVDAVARSAHGKGLRASGSLEDPSASGTIALGGVPVIDDLTTTFDYGDQRLTIERGRSTKIGAITARGAIDLRGREPRAERLVITGRNVDLSKLPVPSGLVAGRASVDLVADGPLDAERVRIDAKAWSDDLEVLGEPTGKLRVCHNHDPDDPICKEAAALTGADAAACTADARRGGRCLLAGIERPDGGSATVVARTDPAGRLNGKVAVSDLAIDELARLAGAEQLPAGGTAALTLDLGGTLGAPTADGTVSLLRTWVLGAYIGDEDVEVRVASSDDPRVECAADRPPPARTSTGKLALCGQLRDGRVVIAAVVGTSGTMPVKAIVDLDRVEIDPFIDLQDLLDAPTPLRAWTSGTVSVETRLLDPDARLAVQLDLDEVAVLVPRTDGDGRPAPLVLTNLESTPLSLGFDGEHVTLNRPVTFETPGKGKLTLDGQFTQEQVALDVSGVLDLADLEPLLGTWFDETRGRVEIAGTVTGSVEDPMVVATIGLSDVALRPSGQDTMLEIPRGLLDVRQNAAGHNSLNFTDLTIETVDPGSRERSTLEIHGGIDLDDVAWGVTVQGALAGKMLLAVAPEQLSQASGSAYLHLYIGGEGWSPEVGGDLCFGRETAKKDGDWSCAGVVDPDNKKKHVLALTPRGLRREIILSYGRIDFDEEAITLVDVAGSLDDEGKLRNIDGEIELEEFVPVRGQLSLDADGIPFRVPRTLDLVLSAKNLELEWGDDVDLDGSADMEITGTLEVVQGRYIRDFRFDEFLRPDTDSGGGSSKPFWEEYPMLGNADLDLELEARSLEVDNNVANVELTGEVHLTGTPRNPRLDGEVAVLRGTFTPPIFRAKFTRTSGTVSFEPFARFPEDTPSLLVETEADYRDPQGQDHLVSLSLKGPLTRLEWDLTTSTGYNKAQTLALILSGRTPDDAQRGAGDPIASDPTQIETTTNPNDSYTDQLVKDVAGDFISLLVADPLREVNVLDVARIEVGTGSVGFHGERQVFTNVNVVGDLEQTVRGRTFNVRIEAKSTNGMAIQMGYLDKKYEDPAEDDVQDLEGKLVYRWLIP